ncbi:hypothetical protein ELBI_101 [Anabaena phage Elbi]|nr:hypothetical protein ELBI_101 [Anabaena phage Elbi]
MKNSKKKYSLTSFRLWKQSENGKWHSYNAVFDYADKDSLGYMSACRLMSRGWTPYAIAAKPGMTFKPLELELVDTSPLDDYLREKDPVSYIAGQCIREYLQKPRSNENQMISVNTPESKKASDLALEKAIQDYKAGKYVLPHLLKKVLENVNN